MQELQQLLDDATVEKEGLASRVHETQQEAATAAAAARRAEGERDRALAEKKIAEGELESLRDAVDKGNASAAAADGRVAGLQVSWGPLHAAVA
jgi:chromosome segregation ATPase